MSHGQTLKEYLRINGITIQAFVDKGVASRTTLYNWFDMDEFDNVIKSKLVDKGGLPEEIFRYKPEQKEHNSNSDVIKMAMEALRNNAEFLQKQLDVALKQVYSRDALIADYIVKSPPVVMNAEQFKEHAKGIEGPTIGNRQKEDLDNLKNKKKSVKGDSGK